jgi:GNAT superfamily N-acetyltransferase
MGSRPVKFQLESVDKWAQDSPRLARAHWEELGLDLDLPLAPNIAKMKQMEDLGMWKVVSARENGLLVGYLLAVVSPHLHYCTSAPMFMVDAYYIAPSYRRGTGTKLIRAAEECARTLGAIKIYITCKVHRDHSKLFHALGYRLSDYAFTKRI